jgi:hypothetical protein
LIHIEKEIEIRRKRLIEKQTKMKQLSKQNHFLQQVKEDYAQYHATILRQKQEQLRAMELLHQYLHELTLTEQLSKNNIKDARYEQRKILHEIKKIKKQVDELVQVNDLVISEIKK